MTKLPNIQYLLFNNYKVQYQTLEDNKSYVLMKDLLYAFEVTSNFESYKKKEVYKKVGTPLKGTPLPFYDDRNVLQKQICILAEDIPTFLLNLNARSSLIKEFQAKYLQKLIQVAHNKVPIINPYIPTYFLKRQMLNEHKIPLGYFSILDEISKAFLYKLELQGYLIPDNLMPDISVGKIFNNWLRDQGYNPETFPTYMHTFGDGIRPPVKARLYPDEIYVVFKHRLIDWIKNHSIKYFKTRDTNILPYLNKVLKQEAINNQSVIKQLKYRPL